MKKFKADGADGLAHALTEALKTRNSGAQIVLDFNPAAPHWVEGVSKRMADDGNMAIYGGGQGAGRRHQVQGVSKISFASMPDPAAQRKVREEQAKRISKLSAIVKRAEPRLLMELLQDFGSIEGLNAKRQADLIQRLEGIRKEYGI